MKLRDLLIGLVVFALLLAGSAPASAAPAAKKYVVRASMTESSTGEVYDNVRVGHTFVGPTRGRVSSSLSLTLNYTPGYPAPSLVQQVQGSNWEVFIGTDSVFGGIVGGTIHWNRRASMARVSLVLNVLGGTGALSSVSSGSAVFVGTLRNGILTGTLIGNW